MHYMKYSVKKMFLKVFLSPHNFISHIWKTGIKRKFSIKCTYNTHILQLILVQICVLSLQNCQLLISLYFCVLVCFIEQVPLIGEIIWYLSFTAWLISLNIMFSRDSEIKSKLTVTNGEMGGDNEGKMGTGFQKHV